MSMRIANQDRRDMLEKAEEFKRDLFRQMPYLPRATTKVFCRRLKGLLRIE